MSGSLRRPIRIIGLLLVLVLASARTAGAEPADPEDLRPPSDPSRLLRIMESELQRSVSGLEGAGEAPLYHLAYALTEVRQAAISASLGGIIEDRTGRDRYLDVDLRLGSMAFDNTRTSRSLVGGGWRDVERAPLDDDPLALRAAFWERTDRAFRDAQERYAKLQTESRVESRREDASGDFSPADPIRRTDPPARTDADRAAWREQVL